MDTWSSFDVVLWLGFAVVGCAIVVMCAWAVVVTGSDLLFWAQQGWERRRVGCQDAAAAPRTDPCWRPVVGDVVRATVHGVDDTRTVTAVSTRQWRGRTIIAMITYTSPHWRYTRRLRLLAWQRWCAKHQAQVVRLGAARPQPGGADGA